MALCLCQAVSMTPGKVLLSVISASFCRLARPLPSPAYVANLRRARRRVNSFFDGA